jgi:hypothetical protein
VSGYLTELVKGVPNVELAMVDRYLEPKLAKDMKVFSDGTIVFAKGDTTRTLSVGAGHASGAGKLKTLDKDVQGAACTSCCDSRRIAYLTWATGEVNAPSTTKRQRAAPRTSCRRSSAARTTRSAPSAWAQGLGRGGARRRRGRVRDRPTEPFAPEEVESLAALCGQGRRLFIALDADSVAERGCRRAPRSGTCRRELRRRQRTVQGLQALRRWLASEYSPTLLANDTQQRAAPRNNSDRALLISNRFSRTPRSRR